MSSRKLNRRQRWRIEKIQAEKEKRLKQNEKAIETLSSEEGSEQRGLVTARFGKQVEVQTINAASVLSSERSFLCHIRANIPDLVVGDEIVWQQVDEESGIIVSLLERDSLLSRKDKNGIEKIIAANVTQVFVVIAPQPEAQAVVIDRYLVACKLLKLDVHLLINKDDLLKDEDEVISSIKTIYKDLVTDFSTCSIHNIEKLQTFEAKLEDQNSILIGQSGVGKSSLVRALTKDSDITTRSLSEKTGLGVHTTSTSRLYHLKNGGCIIDSPGIRDFDLGEIDIDELQFGFSEFEAFQNLCKFRNCLHNKEPGCAITQAVNDGKIHPNRHLNYLAIAENLSLLKI